MKSILFALVLTLFTAPSPAAAQSPLVQENFAFGLHLTVNGSNAVYGLLVPAQVYQASTRPDLGDLRVFNAQKPVPHLLRPQASKEN
ncbi:MAG: DUF3999 family protein, partial [Candidatus Electrothrix sp. AR3]|nr:DUF3999 family protein [Candidatus Electrothrix sp. AR3]